MIFLRSLFFLFLFTCYLFSCPGLSLSQSNYEFVNAWGWGSPGTGNGQFSLPSAVAVDLSGNVYVADYGNSRIQKFTSTGTYITQWGSYGSSNDQFNYPPGVAVDFSGNVYVADYGNNRIQKFSSIGSYITQWGSYGSGNGQFNQPTGVAVDSSGNVFVADSDGNNRIQKFSSTGTYIGQWGSLGSGNGQFNSPYSVAVDSSGKVYVADCDENNRIQKFSSTGTYITQWGSYGSGIGQFNLPTGVAVDSSGNVYVADTNNNRIQKFSSTGTYITQWGSYGPGDGQFNSPYGIAVDSCGNVYVADTENNRIQKFAPSCGCSLSPPAYAYSSQSATGMVTVTAAPGGCTWTATSNDSWIHITSGSSGTGNGTVSFYVDANTTGIARRGTIVIGVEAFTVRQAAGTFYDDPNDFFTSYIYAINTEGITKGCWGDHNYYCPSDVVTRGAMAAFIIRAMDGEDFSYTQTPYFFDVPASNGYFKYVQKMKDDGITGNVGTYNWTDVVIREHMAAFLARAFLGFDAIPAGCATVIQQCVNVAGNWNGIDSGTVTCSGGGDTETIPISGSTSVNITQNGCNVSWFVPSNGVNYLRSGTVSGNTINVSGVFINPLVAGFDITQNTYSASGTISGDTKTIILNGVGSASGSYEGVPGSCNGTDITTLTR